MQSTLLPARRRVAPVVTLLVLAPVIAEVLWGATHLTTLFLLIPEIGVYGCGALIIRALVRYRCKGWSSILLLGIAFAIAEECLILQTSFYPLFAADLQHIYGRAFGVSWVYLLFSLGYESVWGIVLPIQLTELIFPDRRDDPWLGKRGLVIAAIVFLLASAVAWYSWTQRAVRIYYPELTYRPSLLAIVIALTAIVVLAAVALRPGLSPHSVHKTARPAPSPWLVGCIAFVLALPWFGLAILHYGLVPSLPAIIPIVIGLALAGAIFFLVRYWSANPGWQDAHRLALVFGALIASMLVGFIASGIALPVDLIGKLVLNMLAVLGLAYLAWMLHRGKAAQGDA